jgi:serine/threonine-protein kinase SRPK3
LNGVLYDVNSNFLVIRDEKVDIWNLGALIPELVFGQEDEKGGYSVVRHLEEMAALCGPFPKSLLEKGDQRVVSEVFDEEGNVKVKELEKTVGLEKRFEGMDVKERSKFVAFVKRMLVLDPARWPSARELLDDAWLKHNYDDGLIEEEL